MHTAEIILDKFRNNRRSCRDGSKPEFRTEIFDQIADIIEKTAGESIFAVAIAVQKKVDRNAARSDLLQIRDLLLFSDKILFPSLCIAPAVRKSPESKIHFADLSGMSDNRTNNFFPFLQLITD